MSKTIPPSSLRAERKEIAKIYTAREPSSFGPFEIRVSEVPLEELSEDDRKSFFAKTKHDNELVTRGHTRIQEKIKEIRKQFSKAVTAGTRSGSGKIVCEHYDDLVQIWGCSPSSEPLTFGVSSSTLNQTQEQDDNQEELQEEGEAQGSSVNNTAEQCIPKESLKRPAINNVPQLIDNKRKHLEKSLSAAQRGKILIDEAKAYKELKRDLANSMKESSQNFTTAMQKMSESLSQLANGITRSVELSSAAMLAGQQQQPMNQNLFYQSPGTSFQTAPFQGLQQEQLLQQRAQIMHRRHQNQSTPEEVDKEELYMFQGRFFMFTCELQE
eukprot:gene20901-biopygen15412